MNPPAVCVIIAAYNAETTIARAVASALAETEVAEVVLVDDASTDATCQVAHTCDDGSGRLKILVQDHNTGPAAARNRAIAASTSPWIAILDADDYFLPGRIHSLLEFASSYDITADDLWQVTEDTLDAPRKPMFGITSPRAINFKEFVVANVTTTGKSRKEMGFIQPLMRRKFLEDHKLYYPEHLRLGEDYALYAKALALNARLILIPAQGYMCVATKGSLSSNHSEEDLFHLRQYDQALVASLPLTPAEQKALHKHYVSIDCRLQWRLLINAVKKRDLNAAILTFRRPYPVAFYLFKQLLIQVYIRSHKKIRTFCFSPARTHRDTCRTK